jgi:hypothetical protein
MPFDTLRAPGGNENATSGHRCSVAQCQSAVVRRLRARHDDSGRGVRLPFGTPDDTRPTIRGTPPPALSGVEGITAQRAILEAVIGRERLWLVEAGFGTLTDCRNGPRGPCRNRWRRHGLTPTQPPSSLF